ncbi:DUF1822 family protein, partial [Mastigocoleus sp. MO_188.B34]|uniref:DUF1822 family protein n=1 Tax=Mastigocoleus sp. MO_188.B34 TaxID=3036635 RepID=UPI00262F9E2C
MKNTFIESDNFLLNLPLEVVQLESEDFVRSTEISHEFIDERFIDERFIDETLRWQNHQNALALIGFEKWLKQRKPELQVNRNECSILKPQYSSKINAVCNIKVGDLIVCLLNTDNLTGGFIAVTKTVIDVPEFAANFYVLVEVLEEQGQVMIKGFLPYDQLNYYCKSVNLEALQNEYYQLPVSLFKLAPNQLLLYLSFVAPSAIPLPIPQSVTATSGIKQVLNRANQSIVKLSNWLHGTFDIGWEATEAMLAPSFQTQPAFRFRDALSLVERGKLLNLGIEQAGESIALVVGFQAVEAPKYQVSVKVYPTENHIYLPENLQLMVLDSTGKAVMQALARNTNK